MENLSSLDCILDQTKDLRCSTKLLHEKFENMSEVKKAIVEKLGFEGLMPTPPMNVPYKILKDTRHGALRIKTKRLGVVFGLNTSEDLFSEKISLKGVFEENKEIYKRFQEKILKNLIDEMVNIGVDNDQDRLMFKRIFILYIQMTFLLPTTINKVSPIHMAPIFRMDNITDHVLDFIIKGTSNYHLKKKKSIDGCLYALMVVYFHETKHKNKKAYAIPGPPCVMLWDREALVQRIRAEIEGHMMM
ncbi:hypothetical protein Ahy_B08g092897 [Arachis hypogaea]|uniref:Uncharacterized protein n=1 Tax=Arachis hypogaea TaxID=3818 RepID=A0A444Y4V8_ARAHY|nr:hypothetical protein Ahy_B08g092897 [Arachis hypogaea]